MRDFDGIAVVSFTITSRPIDDNSFPRENVSVQSTNISSIQCGSLASMSASQPQRVNVQLQLPTEAQDRRPRFRLCCPATTKKTRATRRVPRATKTATLSRRPRRFQCSDFDGVAKSFPRIDFAVAEERETSFANLTRLFLVGKGDQDRMWRMWRLHLRTECPSELLETESVLEEYRADPSGHEEPREQKKKTFR